MDITDSNGMILLKKKLQALKIIIREWTKNAKKCSYKKKSSIQSKHSDIDKIIDQGRSNEVILNDRYVLLKELHDIISMDLEEMAQKAKVRWAIEGDENSKYFHGILNNKRSHLAIRGVLVNVISFRWSNKMILNELFLSKKSKERCEIMAQINPLVPMVSHLNSSRDNGNSLRTIFQLMSWSSSLQILANRLSSVIPDLISDVQSSFISNRKILDGPFILNELLSWCKYKKLKAMVFKVDFEEAFDSVRGLKQGDPLPPFLFILIMKSLHLSFKKVMNAGLFTGIPLDNSLTISHLFYADDVIFVKKWDSSNLKIILKVLKCFHMASGLKININKSKLMGYGVHSDEVETAARYTGCATFVAPFSHLRVKVGDRMERINSWDDVVFKVTSRLSKWKLRTLSIGGRLTLINSVLTSIPLYQMSSFKVRINVLNILESIRRKFFNGIEGNERKLAFISWDTVLASKKYGGLGV
nr:RNA-directed DNA polymerase, eukaryota [Tanacetum cinerariifolium]